MTTIPLRSQTIQNYMGNQRFNSCHEISRIHVTGTRNGMFNIEARIPGSTTTSSYYEIQVMISQQCQIVHSSCSCPVDDRCKHISKVLLRIRNSRNSPIPSPSREEQRRIQNQQNQIARGACVYIAYACKSEPGGSDFRYSSNKDKFDEETLGVFFSQRHANICARNYVINELELDLDDDDDDDDDDDMDDYGFEYDGQEYGDEPCGYGLGYYHKVWTECKAIEDASPTFRP